MMGELMGVSVSEWVCVCLYTYSYCLLGNIFMVEYYNSGSVCKHVVCFFGHELLAQLRKFNSG